MATITYLSTIEFGAGAVATLPAQLADLGISRPLLVSDHGLAATGMLTRIAALLPEGAAQFLDVPTNPTEAAVRAAAAVYAEGGCDGIVALGGGSPIDLAKGVALLATHEEALESYAAINGGVARISAAVAPVIAIPTTAGTGSEVGRAALLTTDSNRKLGFISPNLIPRRAICDPELTLGLPAGLTAATAMDALSHCIETYFSPRYNPPADAIALDGAVRLWRNIDRVVTDGSDLAARSEVMMGSLQGGLTFQKGLGAVHSLSHALGGLPGLKLHHGTLNAILLPIILDFNAPSITEKSAILARALDLTPDTTLGAAIRDLNGRIGLGAGLRALGVRREDFGLLADYALQDHSQATNPRDMTSEDMKAALDAAYY